jgi:selenocysteine lyase/cysteine desulfurase/DNA-binding Lrp family transcriptional regulator
MTTNLTTLDKQILTELDLDCRLTTQDLSKKIKEPRKTIEYRLKKLENDKIIQGYITSINPNNMGYLMFKVYLQLDNIPEERNRFYNFLRGQKNIYWLGICDGAFDCVFAIISKTLEEYYLEINNILSRFKHIIVDQVLGIMVDTIQFNKKYLYDAAPRAYIKFGGDTEQVGLDSTDYEILSLIANDAKISYNKLSEILNLNLDVLKYKIKRMEELKIIIANRININLEKLGLQFYKTFIYTKALSQEDEWMLIDWANNNANTVYYIRSIAPWQIELEFVVKDYAQFNKIMNEFRSEFPQIIKHYKHLMMIDEYWMPAYQDILDFGKEFNKDHYVNEDQYLKYRMFETDKAIDFNHASLMRPYKEIHQKLISKTKQINEKDLFIEARKIASRIININDTKRIIFGRNTTEALSFVYWMANLENKTVICSDAENKSITRIFKEHRDHGNTLRMDGWSTFSDNIIAEEFEGHNLSLPTKSRLKVIPILESSNIYNIITNINENTQLIILSHIIRNDGLLLDIENIVKKIKRKNKNVLIAIDGAQAFGSLESVDFSKLEDIGVDFYAITPHKTLGSYPIGILYFSKRMEKYISNLQGLTKNEQIIMPGMIDPSYKIKSNIDIPLNSKRILSFIESIKFLEKNDWLKGNNFEKKVKYQSDLLEYFISKIIKYKVHIDRLRHLQYASNIISFRFLDRDNLKIVSLLQQKNVFCSYISETNNIRVSFNITNTKKDIDDFFKILDTII